MHIRWVLVLRAMISLLLLLFFLVCEASFGKLRRQLCLFLAKDQILLNLALVDFVDVAAALVGLLFEGGLDFFRVIAEQFL